MTAATKAHEVVITQRYAEREFHDEDGATIHIGVTTSQVADKKGIDRQLHLEVIQPQKTSGASDVIAVRKNLSWQNAEHLRAAADSLAGVAENWRSIPLPSRNSIEFSTTVVDGFAIGRRAKGKLTEYFVAATDEGHTARCALGSLDALNEFVWHVSEAANHLR